MFCRTSKMSHDHSRHDSCVLRLYSRWVHSILLSLARGMTAVVVGSGALLGLFFVTVMGLRGRQGRENAACARLPPLHSARVRVRVGRLWWKRCLARLVD